MITITNNKIAGFFPSWATYRGFSLLFNNPGGSLSSENDLLKINCKIDSDLEEVGLYRALNDALNELGRFKLTNTYLFCPLPPPSYHMTVWDGLNDGNVSTVTSPFKKILFTFIQNLPSSLQCLPQCLHFIENASLIQSLHGPITFKFKKLTIWKDQVLVARLEASDKETKSELDKIIQAHRTLSNQAKDSFSVKPSHNFCPHVTLGYFANHDGGAHAKQQKKKWTETFMRHTEGLTICYKSISLYGFSDMASYFKSR